MRINLLLLLGLLFIGLAFIQFSKPVEIDYTEKEQFAERVNLALRQVGHQLLHLASDSTTSIPPITTVGDGEYKIELNHPFNYDTLPSLLNIALQDFNISKAYQVTIKSCDSDTILLGYNFLAFENDRVPCIGREHNIPCSNIHISFHQIIRKSNSTLLLIPLIIIGIFLLYRSFKLLNSIKKVTDKSQIRILGTTSYDPVNQSLEIAGQKQSITYRENKLLSFLSSHPNEVLERERIVAEVWNDEGVIVGRSLDVFISRLRKLLSAEKAVNIKNIHGVGYRFELINS